MTSAIESDRFKAKCASGKTYIVIEKTKETKEPRAHNEQTSVTTRKSYFLSTGEKANKLTDKDYLIINNKKIITRKNPILKKQDITDIKTIFDYLKNQALCIAMLLAIPEVQNVLDRNNSDSIFTTLSIVGVIAAVPILSVYNLIWFISSLEHKPKFKFFRIFSIAFLIVLTVAVMWLVTLKINQGLIS